MFGEVQRSTKDVPEEVRDDDDHDEDDTHHVKYAGATSCSVTTHSRVAVPPSSTLILSGANISVLLFFSVCKRIPPLCLEKSKGVPRTYLKKLGMMMMMLLLMKMILTM